MKSGVLIAALAISLFSNVVNSEELFSSCEDTAKDNSYRLLNEYFSVKGYVNRARMLCQRLNNREFLYTAEENIFYCRSGQDEPLACEEHDPLVVFAYAMAAKRFSGKNGKQFVLLARRSLRGDNYYQGYNIFFLVPKNINPRGYSLVELNQAYERYATDDNVCGNMYEQEAIQFLKPPYEIVNENQENLGIRFNQKITNCKTGEKLKQVLEYVWKNGGFQQSKREVVKMQTSH